MLLKTAPIDKSERLFLGLIGLAAFLLRLVYIFEYQAIPFFTEPIVDAQTFIEQARQIAAGDWRGGDEPFWQPPLYPYWLALFCWLFPENYFWAIRLAQIFLGSFSCILIYLIARSLANRFVARSAAIIAVFYSMFIYFDGDLLAVPLEVFLNLLLVYSLLQALDRVEQIRPWLLTGFIGGLAALTRPNILLFLCFLPPLLLWFQYRSKGLQATRALIRPILLMGLALIVLLAPVTVRNYRASGEFILVSTNGGVNFYIGNNAAYDSTVAIRPGKDWDHLVAQPLLAGAESPAARSDYFYAQALYFIKEQPAQYGLLLLRKTGLFWNGPELKRNINLYYSREYSTLLRLLLWDWGLAFPFGLLGAFSIWGLIASWRNPSWPFFLLRSYTLLYIASVVLFFIAARYRVPVLPALIIFAALALDDIRHHWRRRAYRPLLLAGGSIGAIAVLCNLKAASPPELDAQLFHDLGEVHLRQDAYEASIQNSTKALALDADHPSAHHNLAVAHLHRRDYRRSIEHARQAIALYPLRADSKIVLGQALMTTGALKQAERQFEQALELMPTSYSGHYYYGRLLLKQRHYLKAIPHLEKALLWEDRDFWCYYELAQAYRGSGQLNQALTYFQQAHALAPRHAAPLNAIGAMYLMKQEFSQAQSYFEKALSLDGDNAEALINLGFCALQTNQYAQAVAHFERALPRTANSRPVLHGLLQAYLALGDQQRAQAIRRALEEPQH